MNDSRSPATRRSIRPGSFMMSTKRRNSRVLPAFMIATVQVASRASLVLLVQRETARNWRICVQTSHCGDLTASGNIRR